ncbi:expressed unknown protein [Seminavis robusta]|uniref:RING-type domain-containing protein n=1 Tax=Seminavis robusta TaxID=568900 RepID=A0A9N8E3E3_9STRA|nr:expressed unknown protein [Seminavis robusta]|eukprot:Sro485_g152440.1 n/a (377) ;mRNA; r:39145-40275
MATTDSHYKHRRQRDPSWYLEQEADHIDTPLMNYSLTDIRDLTSPNARRHRHRRRNAISSTIPLDTLDTLDRDDTQLLLSYNNDSMDFTAHGLGSCPRQSDFDARRGRVGRRRRSTAAPARRREAGPGPESDGSSGRLSGSSRSPRRPSRIRPPRNDSISITSSNAMAGVARATAESTSLSEFLQLSIAYTASLADQVSDDESVYLAFEEASIDLSEAIADGSRTSETVVTSTSNSEAAGAVTDNSVAGTSNTNPDGNPRRARTTRRPKPGSGRADGKRRRPRPKNPRAKPQLSKLAEEATSSIECPICLMNYDENEERLPSTFRCGHSMCLSHKSQVNGCCPICRTSFRGQALKKNVALCEAATAINKLVSAIQE